MIVRRLHMENYRRHLDTDLEFPDGVIAIVGANGSGKSTILEAIGFAMFGMDGMPRGAKELLRSTHPEAGDVRVTLELELAQHAVIVTRTLRGAQGKHEASLTMDGVPVLKPGANSAKAATQHIEKLLGMDQEAFHTTIVARQKELNKLQQMGGAARKKLILEMLGIGKLDAAILAARERAKRMENQLDGAKSMAADPAALEEALHAIEGDVQALTGSVAGLAGEAKQAEARKQQALDAANEWQAAQRMHEDAVQAVARFEAAKQQCHEHMQQVSVQVQEAQEAAASREALGESRLPELEASWQQFQAAKQAFQAYQNQEAQREKLVIGTEPTFDPVPLQEAQDQQRLAEEAQGALRQEKQALRQRHHRLSSLGADAPCPTCEQPLEGHLDRVMQQLQDEHTKLEAKLHEANEKLAKQQEQTQELLNSKVAYEQALRAWQRVQDQLSLLTLEPVADPGDGKELEAAFAAEKTAERQRVEAETRAKALSKLQEQLAKLQAQWNDANQSWTAATQALQANPDVAKTLEEAQQKHALAKQAWQEQDAAHRAKVTELAVAKANQENAAAALEAAKKHAATLQSLQEQVTRWRLLVNRNKGFLERFRDHLVDRIGPRIQAEASRLLGLFTHNRYPEILLDEGYEIHVTDEGIAYQVERFSGGEADLVHLSVRLAVSRMLAERASEAELRFLALDEVFGALDVHRRDAVLHALRGLTQLYRQVLVITHVDSLQDAFDATWHVRLEEGRAVVTQS